MTNLLYARETRTVYCRHARKLNRFRINCLRRLLRITRQHVIPDTEVLKLGLPQSLNIRRIDFGFITACLIHTMTLRIGYRGFQSHILAKKFVITQMGSIYRKCWFRHRR